jgi:hypothetical protein
LLHKKVIGVSYLVGEKNNQMKKYRNNFSEC